MCVSSQQLKSLDLRSQIKPSDADCRSSSFTHAEKVLVSLT